jgi:type IV fimbrial biogenesis protein FimT
MTLGSKLRTEANDLAAGALLARSEAIKRNQPVVLCSSDDEENCGGAWEDGWVVLTVDGDLVHARGATSNGFRNVTDVETITFQPSGVGVIFDPALDPDEPTFILCRQTPTVGGQEREVTISATGRATVARTNNRQCP